MKKILFVLFVASSSMAFAQDNIGELKIVSQQDEYIIFIDQRNVGTTPLDIKSITEGIHSLRAVDKRTYRTVAEETVLAKDVTITAGETTYIIIEEEMAKPSAAPLKKETISQSDPDLTRSKIALSDENKYKSLFEIESSNYVYQEPGVMSLKGSMYGLIYTYENHSDRRMFKYDGRYFWGQVNYNGSAGGTPVTISNVPDSGCELRMMGGYDFPLFNPLYLTPFIGLGYRYLNDNQQLKDPRGYQRESNYYFIPIGLEFSRPYDNNGLFEAIIEYDYFLSGTQISHLSQFSPAYKDVTNQQNRGYGLRASIAYIMNLSNFDFDTKLFARFWNIDDSEIDYSNGGGVYEPKNNTSEVGLAVGIRY